MAKKNEAITKRTEEPQRLTRIAPAQPAEGFENVDRSDLLVPRLGICQAMSPERSKKNADKYIEGLKEGELFHNLKKERLGTRLRVAVVHFYKSRVKYTGDIGEGIDCRALDGKHGVASNEDVKAQIPQNGDCMTCRFSLWQGDEPPACTAYYNFVIVSMPEKGFPSIDDMLVMSFKSTGVGAAKQWISRMKFMTDEQGRPLPIFGGVHELSVREQSNDKHTWFQFHVEPSGRATPEQREYARALYSMVKDADATGRLKTEEDLAAHEPGSDEHEDKAPF